MIAVEAVDLFAGLAPEARAILRTVGPRWNDDIGAHRDRVIEIYGALAAAVSKHGGEVERDISYGPDARHRLDVFRFAPIEPSRPVVVFVHGGAFTRGGKSMDGQIYNNVLFWFARHGYVGVNVEYRLAPEHRFPAGGEDIARAVQWVVDEIAEFNGSADAMRVIGHSAGGSHLATYLFDPTVNLRPHASVRSAILISARLKADVLADNPNVSNDRQYFGDDLDRVVRSSPISYASRCKLPLMVANAKYENSHLDTYGAEFADLVRDAGHVVPRALRLKWHTLTPTVAPLDTSEETFGRAMLDFMCEVEGDLA